MELNYLSLMTPYCHRFGCIVRLIMQCSHLSVSFFHTVLVLSSRCFSYTCTLVYFYGVVFFKQSVLDVQQRISLKKPTSNILYENYFLNVTKLLLSYFPHVKKSLRKWHYGLMPIEMCWSLMQMSSIFLSVMELLCVWVLFGWKLVACINWMRDNIRTISSKRFKGEANCSSRMLINIDCNAWLNKTIFLTYIAEIKLFLNMFNA